MQNHKRSLPVDYLNEGRERRRLSNYLRTGYFRKISGEGILGERVKRRRLFLYMAVLFLLLTGFLSAFVF